MNMLNFYKRSEIYKHGLEPGISHGNCDKGRREGRKDRRSDGGVWVRNLKSKSCRCNFGVSGNGLSLSLSLSLFVVVVFIRPNDVSRKGRKGGFMWTHFRCE